MLRYLNDIKEFIQLLLVSERFHLLTVMGAPGWAKTHSTRATLQELGVEYSLLGSYATPLALYNKLAEDHRQTIVIDDCADIGAVKTRLYELEHRLLPQAVELFTVGRLVIDRAGGRHVDVVTA